MQCAEQIINRKKNVYTYMLVESKWRTINKCKFCCKCEIRSGTSFSEAIYRRQKCRITKFAKMVIFINQQNEIALPKDAKDKTPDDSHKIYVIYRLICIFFCAQYVAPAQIIFIQMVLFNIFKLFFVRSSSPI